VKKNNGENLNTITVHTEKKLFVLDQRNDAKLLRICLVFWLRVLIRWRDEFCSVLTAKRYTVSACVLSLQVLAFNARPAPHVGCRLAATELHRTMQYAVRLAAVGRAKLT